MPAYPVTGRDGIDLESLLGREPPPGLRGRQRARASRTTSRSSGPYGYNGSSYFNLVETQARHITRCLRHARDSGATLVEVTREANDRYFAEMLRRRGRQVFWQDGCAARQQLLLRRPRRRAAAPGPHARDRSGAAAASTSTTTGWSGWRGPGRGSCEASSLAPDRDSGRTYGETCHRRTVHPALERGMHRRGAHDRLLYLLPLARHDRKRVGLGSPEPAVRSHQLLKRRPPRPCPGRTRGPDGHG